MSPPRRAAAAALAAILALTGGYAAARPGAAAPAETGGFTCGFLTIPFDSTVPGDIPVGGNQTNFDCFAWWQFISLNWPATPGAGFGDPGDLGAVAWETYMPLDLLYPDGGTPPPPWGTQPSLPADCAPAGPGAPRVLSAISKFETSTSSAEAAPQGAPAWLGAQNGTNVWYEVRLNQAEYDYVVANGFYDADRQAAAVAAGTPILLPAGSADSVGTIEVKAAWMEVTDTSDARWQRYKLSAAVVDDPGAGTCRQVTVALVGLHILHKTVSQPTWIWATFEHVDNVPDPGAAPDTAARYNFYGAGCQPVQLQVGTQCLAPGASSPVTVTCTPNTSPPYYLGDGCPGPVPIQVTRVNPIDATAASVNRTAQSAIAAQYPSSVWSNYQLVSVIWSSSSVAEPTGPVQVPRQLTGMQPPGRVANTTLETYAQDRTCTDCHRYATIAPTAADTAPQWSSDFSFALGAAQARAVVAAGRAPPGAARAHPPRP